MLVALGCALFVLFPAESGMASQDLSRVIQGVATGIGFIGAGTILKRTDSNEVQGLTTAASLWLTAAIGLAVGAGQLWLPVISVACAWAILSLFRRFGQPDEAGTVVGSCTPGTPSSSYINDRAPAKPLATPKPDPVDQVSGLAK